MYMIITPTLACEWQNHMRRNGKIKQQKITLF